ncbi:hypothetical protein MHM89_04525 [Pseudoalteromonas sp. CNC9-20]|uniref:hypothetical protein n=1 Tax=Pseudoalteromonas TaxID=53246 RepID=UPI001EF41E44|nr:MULTISPECIES: hypothetical protein [Pseudoalteromonas]MCG7569186.1 hypothetical protein [Pseudoalteromonas sp. CNC9-20]
MNVEGAITDLNKVNRTDDKNAPLPVTGEFKLHVKNPAQILTVKVTADQMEQGLFEQLQKLESDPNGWGLKPCTLNIEYYEGANVARQMDWKGFRLHSVASESKKVS